MYRWDGGFIMVDPEKFEEGVTWYQEVLGWKCVDKITSWVGRKGFMKLPRSGMVTIKSFEGHYEHLQSNEPKGNVRLVFVTYDLEKTLTYLASHKVDFTETHTLPNGQAYCDIFAFDDTCLTIVEESRGDDVNEYPASGIIGYGSVNSIIHVKDVQRSTEWYEKNLGFELVELSVDKGFAHMRTEDAYDRNALNQQFWDHIWFLQDMEQQNRNDDKVRTYFDIRPNVFFKEYNTLIRNGIKPSQIAGDPINGWGGFHIYDPDHNQINVWSYK